MSIRGIHQRYIYIYNYVCTTDKAIHINIQMWSMHSKYTSIAQRQKIYPYF